MPTTSYHVVAKNLIADGAEFDPSLLGYGHAEPWLWKQSELSRTTTQSLYHQLKVRRECGALHSITPGKGFISPFQICTTHDCARLHLPAL